MLYIANGSKNGDGAVVWHMGEPMPEIKTRVVTFQADGDELEMILKAILVASDAYYLQLTR